MNRLPVLVVTLLLAVAASVVTAVAVVVTIDRDDDRHRGPGSSMMRPGAPGVPGWWDEDWESMRGVGRSASESDYLAEMVAHHEEAVRAARELARSDRPEMRALGESIGESQTAQIEQMRGWLDKWYPQDPTDVDYRPMMRDLTGLSGDRLDRGFLVDMIGHHMMAVMMSQHLLWRGTEHREVADLARSIRDDQHAEITRMQRWLAAWFDVDWRPGMGMHRRMLHVM